MGIAVQRTFKKYHDKIILSLFNHEKYILIFRNNIVFYTGRLTTAYNNIIISDFITVLCDTIDNIMCDTDSYYHSNGITYEI